jgi:hypothetical protein
MGQMNVSRSWKRYFRVDPFYFAAGVIVAFGCIGMLLATAHAVAASGFMPPAPGVH